MLVCAPERAPSEGPRSTGAMRPAWRHSYSGHSKLGRIILPFDARIRGSTRPSTFRVAELFSILLESLRYAD